jgi:hypothetical protein
MDSFSTAVAEVRGDLLTNVFAKADGSMIERVTDPRLIQEAEAVARCVDRCVDKPPRSIQCSISGTGCGQESTPRATPAASPPSTRLRERFVAFHVHSEDDGRLSITPELPRESPAVVVMDGPEGGPEGWAEFYRANPPQTARLVTFESGGEGEAFPVLIDPSRNAAPRHDCWHKGLATH